MFSLAKCLFRSYSHFFKLDFCFFGVEFCKFFITFGYKTLNICIGKHVLPFLGLYFDFDGFPCCAKTFQKPVRERQVP